MKKDLLFTIKKKDFTIQTFRSGGKGGQHQNKTDSGVRIIHAASGARGESRTERSQHQNKRIAFERLVNSKKFNLWVRQTAHKITGGETIGQRVDRLLQPANIKIEGIGSDGRWKEIGHEKTN